MKQVFEISIETEYGAVTKKEGRDISDEIFDGVVEAFGMTLENVVGFTNDDFSSEFLDNFQNQLPEGVKLEDWIKIKIEEKKENAETQTSEDKSS